MTEEQKAIARLCLWCGGFGAAVGAMASLILSWLFRLVFGA